MKRRHVVALSGVASLLLAGMAAADTLALLSVPGYSGGSEVEGYAGWFVLQHFDLPSSTGGPAAREDLVISRSSAGGELPDDLSRKFYPPDDELLELRLVVVEVPEHGRPVEHADITFEECRVRTYAMQPGATPLVERTTFACREVRTD